MQRAMAKQAEAERERRAKVINAEGEFQAAAKLGEAAEVLTRFPVAVQLRYLQTMREIASERNTTTFFPLPMDLLRSEEHTSELQSPYDLVCRLLLEKKNKLPQ